VPEFKPHGWEPSTTAPQPQCTPDGAFDLTPGANTKAAVHRVFEQQLDELSAYRNLRSAEVPPTNEEIRKALAEWDAMLQQLTSNLHPILKSKGLTLRGIDRVDLDGHGIGFDTRAYIRDSAGRDFNVDLTIDEVDARTNGRETFQVLEEMVIHNVMAQREAFAARVKALGREAASNVLPFGGGPRK
jgi:hypothetical protein